MGFRLLRSRTAVGERTAPSRDRHLDVEGQRLPVRVVEHPTSRRITLRLLPGGSGLKVTMPAHVSDHELDQFLARNRQWVAARRARLPQTVSVGEGAVIPFRGIDHRIVLTGKLRGLVVSAETPEGPVLRVPGDEASVSRRVRDFLRREARADLDQAVARHTTAVGIRARQIRITDTTSRWGSCSTTRTLSFSWRIIMAPPGVLDYLVAHEVAHLREMNHSDRFWSIVRDLCPQMESHKAWLKRNGSRLHAVALS